MFNGLLGTKTFWVGMATALGGLAAILGGDFALDLSSVGAIFETLKSIGTTDGWNTLMLGFGIITGRHAISKMG
jgi:hypothetical protein